MLDMSARFAFDEDHALFRDSVRKMLERELLPPAPATSPAVPLPPGALMMMDGSLRRGTNAPGVR